MGGLAGLGGPLLRRRSFRGGENKIPAPCTIGCEQEGAAPRRSTAGAAARRWEKELHGAARRAQPGAAGRKSHKP